MPARAAAGGVPGEISALQTQVAELQSIVHTLQDQVSALQASNTALQTQLAAVQSNKALLLGPFVTVDPNPENGVIGPNITFTGANIHIVSGSGTTDDNFFHGGHLTGRGNLIIGYDELRFGQLANRGGSHNLVIGRFNSFTSAALEGLVAGENNTISSPGASVSGGTVNTASGTFASVSGGESNKATHEGASVSGGETNTASSFTASVSGGEANTADGTRGSSVSGGFRNTASGDFASVIGGQGNTANTNFSIRPQPPFP